jgi:hypothetical protein
MTQLRKASFELLKVVKKDFIKAYNLIKKKLMGTFRISKSDW